MRSPNLSNIDHLWSDFGVGTGKRHKVWLIPAVSNRERQFAMVRGRQWDELGKKQCRNEQY
jgi:hypothetical protein